MPNMGDEDRHDDKLPGWMIALLSVGGVAALGYIFAGFLAWQTGTCT